VRAHVRAFCEEAAAAFGPFDPVVEFGSYRVSGQESLADLRPIFPGAQYIGCDARPGPGVDRIEDVAATTLESGSAGAVVCLDTLEHVFRVHDAFTEMHRVLEAGGVLIAATPMRFPIHAHPSDYWRMTPECVSRLAAPFAFRLIGSQGTAGFPHTVFVVAVKAPAADDVACRAARLVAAFTERQAAARVSVPMRVKLVRAVKASYRSKGERRELAEEFTVRFEIVDETATSPR
jgi:SAM-dependent methyltransferase